MKLATPLACWLKIVTECAEVFYSSTYATFKEKKWSIFLLAVKLYLKNVGNRRYSGLSNDNLHRLTYKMPTLQKSNIKEIDHFILLWSFHIIFEEQIGSGKNICRHARFCEPGIVTFFRGFFPFNFLFLNKFEDNGGGGNWWGSSQLKMLTWFSLFWSQFFKGYNWVHFAHSHSVLLPWIIQISLS